MEAAYGMIITDRINEAVKIPTPYGKLPIAVWRFLTRGASTNKAQNP
jgi:hypothetical protein